MNLSELRRQATYLALAETAVNRCYPVLGHRQTRCMIDTLDAKRHEIEHDIDVLEGRCV